MTEQELKLKRGNTVLIEALMDMVNQFFIHPSIDSCSYDATPLRHSFMSAEEHAIDALIESGFAIETDKGYVLLWDKLEERKKELAQCPTSTNSNQ